MRCDASRYDVILMDVQMPEHGRLPGHAPDPRRLAAGPPTAHHRHDRQRHGGRPRALPGRRHGRLRQQADPAGRPGPRTEATERLAVPARERSDVYDDSPPLCPEREADQNPDEALERPNDETSSSGPNPDEDDEPSNLQTLERSNEIPIDPSLLQEYEATLGDDGAQLLAELIAMYLGDASRLIETIAAPATAGDATALGEPPIPSRAPASRWTLRPSLTSVPSWRSRPGPRRDGPAGANPLRNSPGSPPGSYPG